ncbi:hypothetical protein CASFOL_000360 [Castilleja foliolosa]|uniref:Bifunctional inhibitor/plant lipid transfer protein/seed storage helical domain-containing protein n=1 Tax=Castilleja foliolosa TaxID=1961234 RepID=A0ABD3EP16_9LAMI
MKLINPIWTICILLALTASISASLEDDEKDCAEQLTNLAACIPYVSGNAKQPTKECCDGTAKLKVAKPKCLCVLIKESADPSMGLPINTTLALQMPGACNIDANVSDCPTLLKIPADSADAKIFKVGSEDSSTASTAAAANSPSASSASSAATASDNTKTTTSSLKSNDGAAKVSATILLVIALASISLILI